MTRVESSVLVPAPLPDVFAYASDWRKWSEWFEGIAGCQPTTEGTRGNGTRYAYTARVMGFRARVVTEITEFAENVGWTGIARKGMPHRTHWRFEGFGNQTRFTYGLDYHVPVPLLGALIDSLLLKPQWQRIIQASLANLQRHFLTASTSAHT
jgi:uncharacterized membrane protein